MKKIISFSLVAFLFTSAFAQDVNSKEGQIDKKSTDKKVYQSAKEKSLDGRSFKIAFSEKQSDVKPVTQTGVATPTPDSKTLDKPVSDYSMFDANSKVMLTFSDGKLLSPVLADEGCPYKINTSGNEMYAFSSYCRLNTGNKKVNDQQSTAHDTKMEVDAANAAQPVSNETSMQGDIQAPVTTPPDETKQHLPPGTARNDNADLNTPPAGNVPPSVSGDVIQRQVEPPVTTMNGTMATISGVVNGNSIQGTLSWNESDGKKMSYTFSGSAATKKDINDSKVVGMK
jgi:hypothetical protein